MTNNNYNTVVGQRLNVATGNVHEMDFLFQRLSGTIQFYHSWAHIWAFPALNFKPDL